MKRFTNFTALWLSGLALVAALAGHYLIGATTMKFIVDAMLLGASVMICWTWGPAAFRAFSRGAKDNVGKVVLTIWLAWTCLLVQRVWVVIVSALNRPQWLTESPVPVLIATSILIAGAYALLAPATGEDVPRREIINLVVAAAVGGIITGVAIGILLVRPQVA